MGRSHFSGLMIAIPDFEMKLRGLASEHFMGQKILSGRGEFRLSFKHSDPCYRFALSGRPFLALRDIRF